MKYLTFVLVALTFLISCEKSSNEYTIDATINSTFSIDINSNVLLKNYHVSKIAFYKTEIVWVWTNKGLVKLQSGTATVYNTPSSLTRMVHDIAVDSKNNVWIGSDALIKFDGKRFTFFNSKNSCIPEDFIKCISIDSKDNVWFSSSRIRTGGLVKYDGHSWTVYNPDNSSMPINFVQSISIDNDDDVWVALQEGVNTTYLVNISSNNNWTIHKSKDLLGFNPYWYGNIQVNSQNNLCGSIDYSLSSMYPHDGPQAFIFDGSSTKQIQFNNTTNINSITVDCNDNIWLVANDGYAVYNGQVWLKDYTILEDRDIFVIEQAKDNRIWFGTTDGIFIMDPINP